MPHGYRIAAEYESGYIHMENDQDYSPYAPGRNTYFDILHGMPTKAGHGRLMKFSLIQETPDEEGNVTRWDIDWRELPDDARPIHYMEMERSIVMLGSPEQVDSGPICLKRGFGFSFKDPETGEDVVHVEEIVQVEREPDPEAEPVPLHDAALAALAAAEKGQAEEAPTPPQEPAQA